MGVDDLELFAKSGDQLEGNYAVARVRGRARTLLEWERVSLNFLQRLSGVATLAARMPMPSRDRVQVLDTRKTTPGLRRLEKLVPQPQEASQIIGSDSTTPSSIKNNHITAAGGIRRRDGSVREADFNPEHSS